MTISQWGEDAYGYTAHRRVRLRRGRAHRPAGAGPDYAGRGSGLLWRHGPGALWRALPGGHHQIRPAGYGLPAYVQPQGHRHCLRYRIHHRAGCASGGERGSHFRRGGARRGRRRPDYKKQPGGPHRHQGVHPLRPAPCWFRWWRMGAAAPGISWRRLWRRST